MKKNITYIISLMLLAASCASDDIGNGTQTLSGDGKKTPIEVTALLDAGGQVAKTRAADKAFANGDQMVAYLRHVKWDGTVSKAENNDYTVTSGNRNTKDGDGNPTLISKLVTFTAETNTVPESQILDDAFPFKKGVPVVVNKDNSTLTALTAAPKLYWDDFSVSTDDGKQDLRTADHYLQSHYGYCYNGSPAHNETGSHITTDLVQETGVLGWQVAIDQSTDITEFQKSDLLWSAEQIPVRYEHKTGKDENHGQIVIPFLHAMSKVTINVTVDGTFTATDPFASTTVTLNSVRTSCTATAPSATLDYENADKYNVTMQPGQVSDKTKSFQAIIVPSVLTVGNTFATITNMDGNTYSIPITDAIVQNDPNSGWGRQLENADGEDVNHGTAQARPMTRAGEGTIPSGKGYQMKSGVHYILNVNVSKASVSVSATILDWDEIEAEGVGQIHFENDVQTTGGIDGESLKTNGFDVYKAAYAGVDNENKWIAPTFGTLDTHLRYLTASQTWKYDPVIYWQGGVAEYFRALSNVKADAEGTPTINESLEMENGRDALWGRTAEADGYTEGQAVKPRTGKVPLKFYHAMSKITFKLEDEAYTADKAAANDPSLLNLENATIQLTNLATGGKLDLFTGVISGTGNHIADKIFSEDPGAVPSRMGYFAAEINETPNTTNKADVTLKDYVITPQEIGNDAQVIITLADGTVYKAQLYTCKYETVVGGVSEHPYMTEWKGGMHYIYTIKLSKETITFRAEVKNWEEKTGSGNATLEWD